MEILGTQEIFKMKVQSFQGVKVLSESRINFGQISRKLSRVMEAA